MLCLVSACASTPEPVIGPVVAAPEAALGQSGYAPALQGVYVLRGGDVVSVNVFREPDLSVQNIAIGPDGTIALPLAGTLSASGRTNDQLAAEIAERLYAAGLRNPDVSVNVAEFNSHLVTVEGGVAEPGVYPFAPGAKLSSALALAKGPSRVAKLREVVIFRTAEAEVSVAKFDYQAVRQGTMIDPVLEPGDRVVVGISGLSQAWQDAIQAIPVFALFTRF